MTSEQEPVPRLPDGTWPHFEHDGHRYELHGDRIIRDGAHTAVLTSPGFGAGLASWAEEVSPFEPKIVAAILASRNDLLTPQEVNRSLGIKAYLGGIRDVKITWLPIGTRFRIEEYDGSEYLITEHDLTHTA